MKILDLSYEAWVSIGASKLRTFLAVLGIVFGVGSVVLMVAIGGGSKRSVEEAMSKLGTNLLVVVAGGSNDNGLKNFGKGTLSLKEARTLAQLPTVKILAPSTEPRREQLVAGQRNIKSYVIGSTPSFFLVRNWSFSEGDAFIEDDMKMARNVVVIGKTVSDALFPNESPIGKTLRVANTPFRVVGLLAAKGTGVEGNDLDNVIIMPITSAGRAVWGDDPNKLVSIIFMEIVSKDLLDTATEEVISLLREIHKLPDNAPDDFSILSLKTFSKAATDTSQALSLLLGAIASISLIVGGIGIMNIMLVTVTERTREIGIRKAIGATRYHILVQFLMEAIFISILGSLIGLAAGFVVAITAQQMFGVPIALSIWPALLSLVMAITVGICSGLYPAYKASRLQPIEALRTT